MRFIVGIWQTSTIRPGNARIYTGYLTENIQRTYPTQSQDHGTPEADIVQDSLATNPFRTLEHDDGKLAHLCQKTVTSDLFGDAGHNYFVSDGGNEKGYQGCHRTTNMWSGGAVNVSSEEVVDGNVPLA